MPWGTQAPSSPSGGADPWGISVKDPCFDLGKHPWGHWSSKRGTWAQPACAFCWNFLAVSKKERTFSCSFCSFSVWECKEIKGRGEASFWALRHDQWRVSMFSTLSTIGEKWKGANREPTFFRELGNCGPSLLHVGTALVHDLIH